MHIYVHAARAGRDLHLAPLFTLYEPLRRSNDRTRVYTPILFVSVYTWEYIHTYALVEKCGAVWFMTGN